MAGRNRISIYAAWVGFAGFAALAGFFYLSGLDGALISFNDENRAYHFQGYAPGVYLFGALAKAFMQSYDGPFYVWGFFGFINVALVGIAARPFFGLRIAIISSVLYLFFDVPLIFAKQLYYSTPFITLTLVSIVLTTLSTRSRRGWYVIPAGFCGALMFIMHPSSYLLIFGIVVFLAATRWECFRNGEWVKVLRIVSAYMFSILVLVLVADYAMLRFAGESYIDHLSLSREGALEIRSAIGVKGIMRLAGLIAPHVMEDPSRIVRVVVMALFGGYALFVSLKSRNERWGTAFVPFMTAALLLFGLVLSGGHVIRYRHVVWLTVPITWFFAIGAERMLALYKGWPRFVVVVMLALYIVLGGRECFGVTQSLVSVYDIERVLDKHNISKDQLTTRFYIYRYDDFSKGTIPKEAPAAMYPAEQKEGGPVPVPIIYWPGLIHQYQEQGVRYFLSSGYGDLLSFGEHDPALRLIKPLASWPHPRSNRYFHLEPRATEIKLYDLRELFQNPAVRRLIE